MSKLKFLCCATFEFSADRYVDSVRLWRVIIIHWMNWYIGNFLMRIVSWWDSDFETKYFRRCSQEHTPGFLSRRCHPAAWQSDRLTLKRPQCAFHRTAAADISMENFLPSAPLKRHSGRPLIVHRRVSGNGCSWIVSNLSAQFEPRRNFWT